MRFVAEDELANLIEENKKKIDAPLNLRFTKSLSDHVIDLIDETYFRSRFIGFDHLPERNNPDHPLIYASNHSGMAFPWDAIIFAAGFFKLVDYEMKNAVRPLSSPILSQSVLMCPFLLEDFWRRAGAVDATTVNFETLMQMNESNVLIYPEGIAGIGKGFNKKYQLQKFSTSTLRMSLKYRTDIIPFATINAEYINPYVYSIESINRISQKIGIPFIPIGPLTLLLIFQPWLFYFAFPANLTYIMGERIKPYRMIDKPFEDITQDDLHRLRDRIHAEMQSQFDKAVEKYGKKPYRIKEFFSKSLENISKFPYYLPFGWPLIFSEFQRQYNKNEGQAIEMRLGFFSFFKVIFKNPITIAFFLPIIGWIPILMKGLKKIK